ncbi:MAG: HNH endonuclease signature motif containing protein [Porticoccaceae bacterium]
MTCPMCGEKDVTTFELHHMRPFSVASKHEEDNLILLCSNCHSRVTAGEVSEADVLRLKLLLVKGKHPFAQPAAPSNVINVSGVNTGVIANKLEIHTPRHTVKVSAPEGTLASSLNHRNYVKYLIDRYHEFKAAEVGKEEMNYRILYAAITREFGAKWDMVSLSQFEALVDYLQKRIDKTVLGKNMKARGSKRWQIQLASAPLRASRMTS